VHRETAKAHGLEDGDWAWIVSHHGRVKGQIKTMEGVNPLTVWTWNAIGKRKGAWNLAEDSREANKGFLLNHAISELLPAKDGEGRVSNSDPITGQAAWFDLRIRLEKVDPVEAGETAPLHPTLGTPPNMPARPDILRYGKEFRR
jgi:anaerobic selenocysteine-containing dehydrogenase